MRLVVLIAALGFVTLPTGGVCAPPGEKSARTLTFQPVELKAEVPSKSERRKLKLTLPSQQSAKDLGRYRGRLPGDVRRSPEQRMPPSQPKASGVGVEPWLPARGLGVQLGVTW